MKGLTVFLRCRSMSLLCCLNVAILAFTHSYSVLALDLFLYSKKVFVMFVLVVQPPGHLIWLHCLNSVKAMNSTSSFSAFPAISLGFTTFGEMFVHVTVFYSNHRGSHIPSSWMVHAGCVFVAGIHPFRTWTSGSFKSVGWNACYVCID